MSKDNNEISAVQRIDFSLSLQQNWGTDGKVSVGVLDIGHIIRRIKTKGKLSELQCVGRFTH